MNANTAKYLLQNFINLQIKKHQTFTIPVFDEVVVQNLNENKDVIEEWTWRGLIQIAYNLKPES
jgi:hypothetical protein